MKKALLYGAAVVVAICGLYLLLPGKSEPAYKGIKISRWIRTANRGQLETGLAWVGPEAIPYLIAALGKRDTPWTRAWSSLWGKLPARAKQRLARWEPIPTSHIRENAIAGLLGFGPEAKSALPSLIRTALRDQDPMLRRIARIAAGTIGRDSRDVQELESPSGGHRGAGQDRAGLGEACGPLSLFSSWADNTRNRDTDRWCGRGHQAGSDGQ